MFKWTRRSSVRTKERVHIGKDTAQGPGKSFRKEMCLVPSFKIKKHSTLNVRHLYFSTLSNTRSAEVLFLGFLDISACSGLQAHALVLQAFREVETALQFILPATRASVTRPEISIAGLLLEQKSAILFMWELVIPNSSFTRTITKYLTHLSFLFRDFLMYFFYT